MNIFLTPVRIKVEMYNISCIILPVIKKNTNRSLIELLHTLLFYIRHLEAIILTGLLWSCFFLTVF